MFHFLSFGNSIGNSGLPSPPAVYWPASADVLPGRQKIRRAARSGSGSVAERCRKTQYQLRSYSRQKKQLYQLHSFHSLYRKWKIYSAPARFWKGDHARCIIACTAYRIICPWWYRSGRVSAKWEKQCTVYADFRLDLDSIQQLNVTVRQTKSRRRTDASLFQRSICSGRRGNISKRHYNDDKKITQKPVILHFWMTAQTLSSEHLKEIFRRYFT